MKRQKIMITIHIIRALKITADTISSRIAIAFYTCDLFWHHLSIERK